MGQLVREYEVKDKGTFTLNMTSKSAVSTFQRVGNKLIIYAEEIETTDREDREFRVTDGTEVIPDSDMQVKAFKLLGTALHQSGRAYSLWEATPHSKGA